MTSASFFAATFGIELASGVFDFRGQLGRVVERRAADRGLVRGRAGLLLGRGLRAAACVRMVIEPRMPLTSS